MVELFQYYLFFFVMFVFYGIMQKKTTREFSSDKWYVQYLVIVMIALWILIGMRDELYGIDTKSYVNDFRSATSLNLLNTVEPGYNIFVYMVRYLTSNYHVYLMIASVSMIIAMYRIMRKYFSSSFEIIASICIYVLLGLLAFNMAALRQTIALSFGIFAFMYADDGKWEKFLLCVGAAILFHNSAIILILLYPLRSINLKKYGLFISLMLCVVGIVNSQAIVPLIQEYFPFEDRFTQYGTTYEAHQNFTGFFLQLILVLIANFYKNKLNIRQSTSNLLFNTAFIGLIIQSLVGPIAELFRLSFYFSFFDIILVPIVLTSIREASGSLIRQCFILGCLIYIFSLSSGVLPLKENF